MVQLVKRFKSVNGETRDISFLDFAAKSTELSDDVIEGERVKFMIKNKSKN